MADFRHGRHQRGHGAQAAIVPVGIFLLGLLQAVRLRSAVSLARNTSAAMTRLMWRCQPYQERGSQQAFLDRAAQTDRTGQFDKGRGLRREHQIMGALVWLPAAAADQEPALEALVRAPGQRDPCPVVQA